MEVIKTDSTVLSVTPANPEVATTICRTAALAAFGDTAWAVSGNFNSGFSGFTCGVCGGPLAEIELELDGSVESDGNLLEWKVIGGSSISDLKLFRSDNGVDFSVLSAQGLGDNSFLDETHSSGRNFYQLTGTDPLGDIVESNVVELVNESGNWKIVSVYPQPAEKEVSIAIDGEISERFSMRIVSIAGVEIMSEEYTRQTGAIKLNLEGILAGLYFIEVRDAKKSEVRKLLIQ